MKSFQKKIEKWTDTDTSEGITQLLCLAGFTFTKKILWMSYHMCPAREKENIPALRWETLQHLSLVFFHTTVSPQGQTEERTSTDFRAAES